MFTKLIWWLPMRVAIVRDDGQSWLLMKVVLEKVAPEYHILFWKQKNCSAVVEKLVSTSENSRVRELVIKMVRGMGSPRQAFNRRRRTRDGPEHACVQTPLTSGWHTQEEERWIIILSWYRLVRVTIPPVSHERGRVRLPQKGQWPPRGEGTTVLTYPGSASR